MNSFDMAIFNFNIHFLFYICMFALFCFGLFLLFLVIFAMYCLIRDVYKEFKKGRIGKKLKVDKE